VEGWDQNVTRLRAPQVEPHLRYRPASPILGGVDPRPAGTEINCFLESNTLAEGKQTIASALVVEIRCACEVAIGPTG
jgi:hypothetical protein